VETDLADDVAYQSTGYHQKERLADHERKAGIDQGCASMASEEAAEMAKEH
jgi:hypothetical protein